MGEKIKAWTAKPWSGLALGIVLGLCLVSFWFVPPASSQQSTLGTTTSIQIVTNLFATTNFVQVSYTTNLFSGRITVQNLYVNDGVISNSIHYVETTWPGPTNAVNLSKSRWTYATIVPFSITNLFGGTNGMGNPTLLTVSNASSSNVTWTYHPSIASRNGDTLTLSNGHVVKIGLDSDFSGSNAVSATFPH